MNFLNVFEERIAAIFNATPEGYTAPFSFKKLAKRAAREMENETFVIDGVDTAPGLYTILVSADDDAYMRPLYGDLTPEIAKFIEGQANKKGYVFTGKPLVRFMVDPSLKRGKFSVFAENVDPRSLNRLREEEKVFIGGIARGNGAQPIPRTPEAAPAPRRPQTSERFPEAAKAKENSYAGLDVMPSNDDLDLSASAAPNPIVQQPYPGPSQEPSPVVAGTSTSRPRSAAFREPRTKLRPQPARPEWQTGRSYAPSREASRRPAPARKNEVTCTLQDMSTGRVYTAYAPQTPIGREKKSGGIVLRDPNVSRHHAILSYDGSHWYIQDLDSTNGTFVNDAEVTACALSNGDIINIGLENLEFRES